MIRRPAVIAMLCAIMLSTLLLWPAFRHMSGAVRVAKDAGIEWYFVKDGIRLGEYEAGAMYLDAIVVSYHVNVEGDPYTERNNWHLDRDGRRYKISSTSSFDCEGTELGT